MFKRIVAAVAACLLGMPGVAAAQSQERFVVIDAGISSKVLNELSSGAGAPTTFLSGGRRLPVLGHAIWRSSTSQLLVRARREYRQSGRRCRRAADDPAASRRSVPKLTRSHRASRSTCRRSVPTASTTGFGPKIATSGFSSVSRGARSLRDDARAGPSAWDQSCQFQWAFSLWQHLQLCEHGRHHGGPTTAVAGAFSGRSFRSTTGCTPSASGRRTRCPSRRSSPIPSYGGDRLDPNSTTAPSSIFHGRFRGVGRALLTS